MGLEMRWCAECGGERAFEVPPCADGHGAGCADRACVDCGFAIVVAVFTSDDAVAITVESFAA